MNYLLTTWKTVVEISESVLIGLLFFFRFKPYLAKLCC